MHKKKARVVVFDENSRREFVTGFRKRKLARKKKAAEEFEKQLKEAKKKIKEQVRQTYKKIIHPIQTVDDTIIDLKESEYELPEHIVKVKELLPDEIAEQNNWIGRNRMCFNENNDEDNEHLESVDPEEPIPGMSISSMKEVKKIVNNQASALMQNDAIFKKKNKLERLKNRKKATRKRNMLKREQKKLKGRKRK